MSLNVLSLFTLDWPAFGLTGWYLTSNQSVSNPPYWIWQNQEHRLKYYVSKKSCPILFSKLLYRIGQDFWDIQYFRSQPDKVWTNMWRRGLLIDVWNQGKGSSSTDRVFKSLVNFQTTFPNTEDLCRSNKCVLYSPWHSLWSLVNFHLPKVWGQIGRFYLVSQSSHSLQCI